MPSRLGVRTFDGTRLLQRIGKAQSGETARSRGPLYVELPPYSVVNAGELRVCHERTPGLAIKQKFDGSKTQC